MKRALTAGGLGLALGVLGAATNASDSRRDETDSERDVECTLRPDLALVFAYDYHPGMSFWPTDRLPQETVNAILGRRADGSSAVVPDPTEYRGYVGRARQNRDAPGEYTFVFVREETLRRDRRYRLTADATFFASQLRLLQVGIRHASGTEMATATRENETGTTATRENETTQEVVVETTTEAGDEG